MPFPGDITNPKVINFLLECYEKEAQSRLSWREKHSQMFQKAATFRKPLKNYTRADIDYALAAAGMAATARDHIEAARHRLTHTSKLDYTTNGDTKTKETALLKMFPVKPEDQLLMVEEGRKAYLKRRNELSPEDKYVFPEATSWTYGWRFKECEVKPTGSRCPRIDSMKSALYNNVGPQPDPDYYHDPNTDFSCCSRFT